MPSNIISSYSVFSQKFPDLQKSSSNKARLEALKTYFGSGGVISVGTKKGAWPKLIYPSPRKLELQIKEISSLRKVFLKKQQDWEKEFNDAKVYHIKHNITKFSDPLYWKHIAKCAINRDYKEDSEAVSLPVHLVGDSRWKPMIKMFVTDIEYRKQLTETVQNSIVYEKDRKVARYANELQAFRMGVSNKKIDTIKEKVSQLDAKINALKQIQKWAKE
jgi:hypothetical protein